MKTQSLLVERCAKAKNLLFALLLMIMPCMFGAPQLARADVTDSGLALTDVHDFNPAATGSNAFGVTEYDGSNPYAPLIEDRNQPGRLFGTTELGGGATYDNSSGNAKVFKGYGCIFELLNFAYSYPIYSFADDQSYSYTGSTLYSTPDGAYPFSGLIQAASTDSSAYAGNFYGTTEGGGTQSSGTVYDFSLPNGYIYYDYSTYSSLSDDGYYPYAGLVEDGAGKFFGIDEDDDEYADGEIFEISNGGTQGATFTNEYFLGANSEYDVYASLPPSGSLIVGNDGYLYGDSSGTSSSSKDGNLFAYSTSGALQHYYNFTTSATARHPLSTFCQDSQNLGTYYATDTIGGANVQGSIVKWVPTGTGSFTPTLSYSFTTSTGDGEEPLAGLWQGPDHAFYGTTLYGGQYGYGEVFRWIPGSTPVQLYSFTDHSSKSDGATPAAPLMQATDKNLYSTTVFGGASAYGTVFKLHIAPYLSVAATANPTSILAGASSTLSGTAVEPVVNNSYPTYAWTASPSTGVTIVAGTPVQSGINAATCNTTLPATATFAYPGTYTMTVTVTNGLGVTTTGTCTVTVGQPAPTATTPTVSLGIVTDTWSAPTPTPSTYTLERSASATLTTPTTIFTGNALTATDSAAAAATSYYYAVDDTYSTTVSAFSSAVQCVTPAAATTPTATASAGSTTVTWAASTGLAASPTTGYNVWRSTAAAGTYTQLNSTPITSPLSYSDTTGVGGTTYYYKTQTINAYGTSALSTASSGVIALPGVPTAPTLTATGGTNQIVLSWTAPTGTTSYTLYRGTSSGNETTTLYTGTATTYTDTSVTDGTTYYYIVIPSNAGGTGATSNEAHAVASLPTPAGLTATAGDSQVVLNWTATTGASGYYIYRGTSSGGESGTAINSSVITGTTYTDTTVTNGTKYYYYFKAISGTTYSAASNEVSATPSHANPSVTISATPNPTTTSSTNLSSNVTLSNGAAVTNYKWTGVSGPAAVVFSDNNDATANAPTATFSQAGTYTGKLTITDSEGGTATSNTLTITVNQSFAGVTVTPNPESLNLNGSATFSASAVDQFGNALTTQPSFTWSLVTGTPGSIVATTGVYSAGTTAGTGTVKASATVSGSTIAGTATVTVNDVNPTSLSASANPNPVTTGTTTTLSVTSSYPAPAQLSYNWVVTSPAGDTSVTFDGNNGTNAASSEVATFTKAGTFTFTVTLITQNGKTASTSVTVVVQQTANGIVITPNPASVVINGTVALAASEVDQFGNPMSPQPTLTWSITTNQGASTLTSTTGATNTFNAASKAGTAVINVTDGTISATDNIVIQNQLPKITVTAAATPNPVTGTTTDLTVTATWTGGESNLTYTWANTSGPGTVTFDSNNGTNAGKSEIATFNQAGTYGFTVTVTDTNGGTAQSSVTVTVNQTLSSVTVTPNPVSMNIGDHQTFSAIADDQFGNAMATQPTFTWSVPSGVGSINSSTGAYSAGTVPGTAMVQAASGSITGTASVTVNDVAPTVANPATANPNPTTLTTTNLTVLGSYLGGENELTYTWSKTSGPGTVTFSPNGTNAASSSVATFSKVGSYVLKATITDPSGDTVTSSVTVTVTAVPTTVAVTPANDTVNINGTDNYTATVADQFGNTITSPTVTWSVSSTTAGTITSAGVYTAGTTPGTYTVTASATAGGSTMTGSTGVTVADVAPTLSAITVTPSPVTGTTATAKVTGTYSGTGSLSYSWSATGPAAVTFSGGTSGASGSAVTSTATFSQAGSYTIKVIATDSYGTTATQTTTVTVNQTPTTLTASPTTATIVILGTQAVTGTVYDQFGNALTTQPTLTYTLTSGAGSVSSSGLYTAPSTTTTAVVTVSSGSLSDISTITVNDQPPTVATAAAASPNPATGNTTHLTVTGAWVGGATNLKYTWALTSGPTSVAFSVNGTVTAKATTATFTQPGTYGFTVTISDPNGGSVTSFVSVVVSLTLTTITVSPAAPTLNIGANQSFTATGYDQFGNVLATQPTFTWSASGDGTIGSSTGYFTAGTTPGTSVVTATSGSASGTANVTVQDAAPVAAPPVANPNPVPGKSTTLTEYATYPGGTSGLTYSWSQTAGATATLSGTTGQSITATFPSVGTYTFSVTVKDPYGLTSTASTVVTVEQYPTTLTVTPSTVTLPYGGTQTFTASETDQYGNTIASPSVTWTAVSGTITSAGVYTAPASGTSDTVTATDTLNTSLTGTATVTLSSPPSVTITLNSQTGTTASLTANGTGTSPLSYAWSVTPTATGTVSPTSGANTTLTVTAIGTYTVTVIVTDGLGQTSSATQMVTFSQIATTVTVTPNPGSVLASQTLAMSAAVKDQFGNAISSPTVTWNKISGPGVINASTGVYTAGAAAGTAKVQATSGSATGQATINVTVSSSPSASITLNSQTGTTASLTGSATGGTAPLTYAWSVTPSSTGSVSPTTGTTTTLTATAAGTYTVSLTVTDANSMTSTVTKSVVFAQTPTTLTVTPNPGSVLVSQTLAMTATLYDQFGNPISSPTVSWTKTSGPGSINGTSGVYTAAATAGTAVVKATASAISGSATINITAAPTVSITLNSQTSTTAKLTASGTGTAPLSYSWSVTPTSTGSVSPTSGTTTTLTVTAVGTYTVSVTVTDANGHTASTTQNVVFSQVATSITVSPSTTSIATGGTQSFSASELDQFGNAMTTQPTFTWSVTSGGGSVTSAGLYTAPASAGTATVQAKAGTITGTAAVTITQTTVPPQLVGSVAKPGPLSPNFTTEGTSDWAHWGRGVPGLDHKSTGNSQISAYTEIGTAAISAYRTDTRQVTWSDGTPTATSTNEYGVQVAGTGNGYTFTAPADDFKVRTLVVYVGGTTSGGKLTATLSDGSAAQYVDVEATNSATGGYDLAYTFAYAAASANQTLTVTYTLNTGTGNVRLCGATLH